MISDQQRKELKWLSQLSQLGMLDVWVSIITLDTTDLETSKVSAGDRMRRELNNTEVVKRTPDSMIITDVTNTNSDIEPTRLLT
jgi:hypothetical protein